MPANAPAHQDPPYPTDEELALAREILRADMDVLFDALESDEDPDADMDRFIAEAATRVQEYHDGHLRF